MNTTEVVREDNVKKLLQKLHDERAINSKLNVQIAGLETDLGKSYELLFAARQTIDKLGQGGEHDHHNRIEDQLA